MKKLFPTTVALCALLLAAGCDSFLDVNEDPNQPTEASLSGLLSGAAFHTAEANYDAASITSYYVQHLASPTASNLDRQYEVRMDDTWFRVYSNALADLDALRELAVERDAPAYEGIANVLIAYNLGLATDLWGAVPYSEAFEGAGNLTPGYDEQEAVYDTILQLLGEDTITLLDADPGAFAPGAGDFIHQGDLDNWMRTAHALRARYLNHLSEKGAYDPQAVLDAVDGAYTSNADDAQVAYTEEDINPWALVVAENEAGILGGYLSDQFVEGMNGETYGVFDPRLPQITDSLAAADAFSPPPYFIGTVNGAGFPDTPFNVLIGESIYDGRTSPIYLVTYAEVKLIEAEAAFRAGQTERAYDAYLEGIRAHMRKTGVPAGAADDYLEGDAVSVGAGGLMLDDIFREKWKALFLNPEAWVDVRRHDYDYQDMEPPVLQNPDLQGDYIRRILYPNSELERNDANVPDVSLGDPLWWDQ